MSSTKTLKKAVLVYHSKIQLVHQETNHVAIAELKVWEVQKDTHFPEGLKYSLFLVMKESGLIVVGFDNHKPKGPHVHRGRIESPYNFKNSDLLIEDFWHIVSKEGFSI